MWTNADLAICPVHLHDMVLPTSVFEDFNYYNAFEAAATTGFHKTSEAWVGGIVHNIDPNLVEVVLVPVLQPTSPSTYRATHCYSPATHVTCSRALVRAYSAGQFRPPLRLLQ